MSSKRPVCPIDVVLDVMRFLSDGRVTSAAQEILRVRCVVVMGGDVIFCRISAAGVGEPLGRVRSKCITR